MSRGVGVSYDAKAEAHALLRMIMGRAKGDILIDKSAGRAVVAALEHARASAFAEAATPGVRKVGDLFVTLVRNPDESPFGIGETIRWLGDHPDGDGDIEFYESLDGKSRGWVAPKNVKPSVAP